MIQATSIQIEHLIAQYGLHDDPGNPVPIYNLEPCFPVRRHDLSGTGVAGMVILPPTLPISETNFAPVVLADALGPDVSRVVYAHEVAHGLLGHAGELRIRDMDGWFTGQAEREAWRLASRLLVPPLAWWERGDIQRVAADLRVPVRMVEMAVR